MRNIKSSLFIGSMTTVMLSSGLAYSGGLEKSVSWSGRYSGIGGAAVSNVEGSEALYFNPANLTTTQGAEISGNFSGIFPRFSAPFTSSATIDGKRPFKPAFGAFANYTVNERLVVGLGTYVSGAAAAQYDNVNLTGIGASSLFKPTVEANLALIEYSLGAGYELMEGLRVGAAWRVLHASGTIGTLFPALSTVVGALYDNLSTTRYNGFRLGVSYAPKNERWGLGATWRSSVDLTLKGQSSGSVNMGTGITPPQNITGGAVSVLNSLPYQITFGGHYEVIPSEWKVFAQYDFTHYTSNQTLGIQGTVKAPAALGGASLTLPNIPQFWQNLSVGRIGTEYVLSKDATLRAGYVYTSQVTPGGSPNPVFYAPGAGNTFVVGVGNTSWVKNLAMNLTAEYSTNSGKGHAAALPTATGTYKANDFSFHLGATYQL